MFLAIVTLDASSRTLEAEVDTQTLVDMLWTRVLATEGVEHISAAVHPDRIDLGFYVRADSQHEADRTARSIGDRACRTAPQLRDFRPGP